MTLTELIEAARELPPGERVKLADELLDSVEEPADPTQASVEEAWLTEIRRRVEDIDNGRVELVDGAETIRIARARIAARTAARG